jgi:hypothetical protein
MSNVLKPEDLRKISDDADLAKAKEYMAREKKKADEESGLHEAFMGRSIHPQVGERISAAVKRAAEQGLRELQVITFPATYTNDGGRRINNFEEDWPTSLQGFAKLAYDYYNKELKPLGYKLIVRVIDYPGGMPGNVGMFLKW